MKVRLKEASSHYHGKGPFEVSEESASFYIGQPVWDRNAELRALPKLHYEPIPTDTWRDVSSECEVGGIGIFHYEPHKDHSHVTPLFTVLDGYRLLKIEFPCPISISGRQVSAFFLIEKKDPA